MKEEKLKERDEMVSCLLEELVKVRQNLAESEDTIRNLKTKIQELEEVNLIKLPMELLADHLLSF